MVRTEWRYSVLAGKLIAQDSGHVCQNLYLACEAIGVGTCAVGAYDQDEIDAFVEVDGVDEFTVYMELLPNAEMVTLKGHGHGAIWTAPDVVAQRAVEFIDRVATLGSKG